MELNAFCTQIISLAAIDQDNVDACGVVDAIAAVSVSSYNDENQVMCNDMHVGAYLRCACEYDRVDDIRQPFDFFMHNSSTINAIKKNYDYISKPLL